MSEATHTEAEYVEAMQMWTDALADNRNLFTRLQEEIARVTRAENALREVLIACSLKEQVAVAAGYPASEARIFTMNIRARITEAMTP